MRRDTGNSKNSDISWVLGELEFAKDEVRRARRRRQKFELCDVMAVAMAVAERLSRLKDKLNTFVLIDSGAYLHVRLSSFAPMVRLEKTASLVAQAA